jgi:hypothetical protein
MTLVRKVAGRDGAGLRERERRGPCEGFGKYT